MHDENAPAVLSDEAAGSAAPSTASPSEILAGMNRSWRAADAELSEHLDAYVEQPFVPFPSVAYAVEALIETAGMTYSDEGSAWLDEVAHRITEEAARRRDWR